MTYTAWDDEFYSSISMTERQIYRKYLYDLLFISPFGLGESEPGVIKYLER